MDLIVPLSIATIGIQCNQADVIKEYRKDFKDVVQHLVKLIHSKQDHDARAKQFVQSCVPSITVL